jgi:hypothetical protein
VRETWFGNLLIIRSRMLSALVGFSVSRQMPVSSSVVIRL